MSITEFLLERIAQDEAAARDNLAGDDRWPTSWSKAAAARVLAECEAKRRIVKRAERLAAEHYAVSAAERYWNPQLQDWRYMSESQMRALIWVMHDLAAVYAEHEDFQEEWRV